MERAQRGLTIGIGAAVLIALVFAMVPPVMQDPAYHAFADRRTLWGVPNFWNVITNAGFLLVALYGLKSLRSSSTLIASWERTAYAVLLAGSAAVSAGSSYYHLHPDDATLFWDRLPMAVIFMALLAAIIGERLGAEVGQRLLLPLLVFGAGSVFYWRFTGDLRLYGVVQFGTMLALPLILLAGPARYTLTGGLWWTAALYAAAKIAEFLDRPIAGSIATGGHPWKHLLAAGALFAYVRTVARRQRMDRAESSYGESRGPGDHAVPGRLV